MSEETVLKIKLEDDSGKTPSQQPGSAPPPPRDTTLMDRVSSRSASDGIDRTMTRDRYKARHRDERTQKTADQQRIESEKKNRSQAQHDLRQRLARFKASRALQRSGAPPLPPQAGQNLAATRARRPNTWSRRVSAGFMRRFSPSTRRLLRGAVASSASSAGAAVGAGVTMGTGSATLGSAAGTAAGAIMPAMMSNPIGIALLGAGTAAKVLTESFGMLRRAVDTNVNRMADYSGKISKSLAIGERESIHQTLRHAQQTEGEYAKYVEASDHLSRQVQEIKHQLTTKFLPLVTSIVEALSGTADAASQFIGYASTVASKEYWTAVGQDIYEGTTYRSMKVMDDKLKQIADNTNPHKNADLGWERSADTLMIPLIQQMMGMGAVNEVPSFQGRAVAR